VNVLSSADKSHRRHSESVRVHCPFCCFDYTGVVRQSEIIVCAKAINILAQGFAL
jgi:hypothetical protein